MEFLDNPTNEALNALTAIRREVELRPQQKNYEFFKAIQRNHLLSVAWFLDKNPKAVTWNKFSPKFQQLVGPAEMAMMAGYPQMLELLLLYGADKNAGTSAGSSSERLIHFAITLCEPEMVGILIKAGADLFKSGNAFKAVPNKDRRSDALAPKFNFVSVGHLTPTELAYKLASAARPETAERFVTIAHMLEDAIDNLRAKSAAVPVYKR